MTAVKHYQCCRFLPLFLGLFTILGIIGIYVLAIERKDVLPFIPYISDAGGSPPQSGIFSIILFFSAAMTIIVTMLRYYGVREAPNSSNCLIISTNFFAMLAGLISACGMLIVAAYPVRVCPLNGDWDHMVRIPHVIGAILGFLGGLVYISLQTLLSFFMRATYRKNSVILTRMIFNIIALSAFIVGLGLGGSGSAVHTAHCSVYVPTEAPTTTTLPTTTTTTTLSTTAELVTTTTAKTLPPTITEDNDHADDPEFNPHDEETTSTTTTSTSSSTTPSTTSTTTTTTQITTTKRHERDDPFEAKEKAAIVMEWVLAFSIMIYFMTFYSELRHIVVKLLIFPNREDYEDHEFNRTFR